MKIGILGDTHGASAWTKFALGKFHDEEIDTILQVGDFGVYDSKSGHSFLKTVNFELQKFDQKLYFVPGNHEDWDYIERLQETSTQEDGWVKVRSNIFFAPRGFRWTWGGVNFLGASGAPSVDRQWRLEDMRRFKGEKLWWEQEMVSPADVDKIVADGRTQVVVAHDVFNDVPSVDAHIAGNPMGFHNVDLLYAAEGRLRMTEIFRGTAPETWLHGHYHIPVNNVVLRPSLFDGKIETRELKYTQVVGLAANGSKYALGHYDTDLREAFIWDTKLHTDNYTNRT